MPRQEAKDNWPVIEKLQVPIAKQARFRGSGGHNLRKLTASTGEWHLIRSWIWFICPC